MNVRTTGPILSSALLFALFLPSCSGGGGKTPDAIVGCNNGAQALCVTACNLGCSTSGCSLSNIAVNQRLDFTFNLEIDPASVNTNTVRMRDKAGNEPLGAFLVQGATISFVPEVGQAGGETFFGFTKDETYTLLIPSKGKAFETLRSTSGDALSTDFSCRLEVSLGIVDFDGQPPRASMLIPSTLGKACIERNTNILIEFSELVDPQTVSETSQGMRFQIAQADSNGNCSTNTIDLPGVRTLSVDKITQRTRLAFRPAFEPPGGFCILATVTDQVRDLSGKRAQQQTFSFLTCAGDVPVREIVDDFSDPSTQDLGRGGAKWVQGAVVAPLVGGSGLHGDFDYAYVATDTTTKDAQDREIWQIDVDTVKIPDLLTLSGQEEPIVNGIFEFTSFVVPAGVHLQFVGSKVPVLRVSGRVDIEGAVTLPPKLATKLIGQGGKPPVNGQPGFAGAIGGGTGGNGGDSPNKVGTKNLSGTAGEALRLPAGHPFTATAANTGGKPTGPWPSTGIDKDVKFSAYTGVICQTATPGGSGGSFLTQGKLGSVVDNMKGTEKSQPYDFGPVGTTGTPVDIALLRGRTEKSSLLYLVGGAGGGGAGTHPSSCFDASGFEPLGWSPGSGGAGGGGILHFQVGSDFNVGIRGIVSVQGGSGQTFACDQSNFTNPAPGGAGSGGSILLQVGGLPDIRGTVTAAGGLGGRYDSSPYLLTVDSLSGEGGAGLLRYESNPPPALAALGNFNPPVSADNVGTIHSEDVNTNSILATDWYDTGLFFPPKYLRYVIEATIDDVPTVFSDDATLGREAKAGEPIEILFQGAQLDAQTKRPVPATFSQWISGNIDGLTRVGGNTFRVLLRFNRSSATKIVVNKMTYRYQG
ncbi:MAG: hypothetical protein H6832_16910 [Planctomycetes bacterium]|nr:hypothetical protein [Planctomycetota bacterium]MCB9920083.1 hypothetical protein [Planctomycetota bacterium]